MTPREPDVTDSSSEPSSAVDPAGGHTCRTLTDRREIWCFGCRRGKRCRMTYCACCKRPHVEEDVFLELLSAARCARKTVADMASEFRELEDINNLRILDAAIAKAEGKS